MNAKLNFARDLYDSYVINLEGMKASEDELLEHIQSIASFAWKCHTGYLRDNRLDKLLDSISVKKERIGLQETEDHSGRKHVIFVASTIYNVGGHTRIMLDWIATDVDRKYTIILTNQRIPIPEFVRSQNVRLFALDLESTLKQRALTLRKIVEEEKADLIVLNQHPNDVIPHVSLKSISVPIVYFNHADHVFWLGSGASDLVLDFRSDGRDCTQNRRRLPSEVLPYRVGIESVGKSKDELRSEMNLKEPKVLVTMASGYKFQKNQEVDFLNEFAGFLNRNKDVGLYVIGVCQDRLQGLSDLFEVPDNMHLLGELIDPRCYVQSADLFVEPYPMSSGLAMAEVAHLGIPIFWAYSTNKTIFKSGAYTVFFPDQKRACSTREQYFADLRSTIDDPNSLESLYENLNGFLSATTKDRWLIQLSEIYASVSARDRMDYEENVNTMSDDDARFSDFCSPNVWTVFDRFIRLTRKPLNWSHRMSLLKLWLRHKRPIGVRSLARFLWQEDGVARRS